VPRSLQARVEGAQHPDRNAQFERINAKSQDCIKRGIPVISADTKKKALIGNFKNGGREWQPRASPSWSTFMTFPATRLVMRSLRRLRYRRQRRVRQRRRCSRHPVFAATSIEAWWKQVGQKRYAKARGLSRALSSDG
jgi:hypothetical protein